MSLTAEEPQALADDAVRPGASPGLGPDRGRPRRPPRRRADPLPVWEDLWRCFAVSWLGGPSPAEKILGIPANTLRQWINDREAR